MFVCVLVIINCASMHSQMTSFDLVYDRITLSGDQFGPKIIRVSYDDDCLLFASYDPPFLLRSRDKGETFETASQASDYVRVEAWPGLYLWEDGRAAIVGAPRSQSGTFTLTSSGPAEMFEVAAKAPPPVIPVIPAYTNERGVGSHLTAYTLDYGKTWSSYPGNFLQLSIEKVYSPIHGFLCRNDAGARWYSIDTVANVWKEYQAIPSRYEKLRSTSEGVLIAFSPNSIAWLRPGDSSFAERSLFRVPNKSGDVALQLIQPITWRGNRFYCIAKGGSDWYLLGVDKDSVHALALVQTAESSSFELASIDERGCLVKEKNWYGQSVNMMVFRDDGKTWFSPELSRIYPNPMDQFITWSSNTVYVTEMSSPSHDLGHLYRSTAEDPRMEHVGKVLKGEAEEYHRSMSWCALDTLDGRLIGRDAAGAVMEFTTEGQMRGFLLSCEGAPFPLETVNLTFEQSIPKLIVVDSHYVYGLNSASIKTRNVTSGRGVYNAKNPLTMLQRGKDTTFYFGRREILRASYDGTVRDTIPVTLPGEKQDSIGVLSDIVEIDSSRFVVALKGYTSQNYDGDTLAVIRGGIVRSSDRGRTWERVSVPTTDQAFYSMQRLRSGAILAVSVNAAIVTDSATKSSAIRCYSGTILRSTDDGGTWSMQEAFSLRNAELTRCSYRIWQGDQRIYIATPEAVMISTDDGQTWTAEINFPAVCVINGVAEYRGQLYVATSLGIYRENTSTSVDAREVNVEPTIHATASHSGQAWRITVTGLPTARILGIDVYDIQGRQHSTEQLWSQESTASVTSPLPSQGVYGVVVHGPNGQRWTTTVGVVE